MYAVSLFLGAPFPGRVYRVDKGKTRREEVERASQDGGDKKPHLSPFRHRKNTEAVEIRCPSCEKSYDLPVAPQRSVHERNLLFAKCPHCGVPRDKSVHALIEGSEMCRVCNTPTAIFKWRPARGICAPCYQKERRKTTCVRRHADGGISRGD